MKNIRFKFILLLIIFYSCKEEKFILKNNTIKKITSIYVDVDSKDLGFMKLSKDSISTYTIKNGFRSKLTFNNKFIIIEKDSNVIINKLLWKKAIVTGTGSIKDENKIEDKGKFFYQDLKSFKFLDSRLILQALTIPLKIRTSVENPGIRNVIPNQAETGLNPALALGYKFNYNWFKINKNFLDKNLNQFSVTPGIFFGTGAVEFKKNFTNPSVGIERKVPMISTGPFIMFGYNNINLGYSIGFDNALDSEKKSWLYQRKLWHGIILGIDIIK